MGRQCSGKSVGGVDLSHDREIIALLLKGVDIARCQREAKLDLLQSLNPVFSASIQPMEQRHSGDLLQPRKKYRASKNQLKGKKDLDPVIGDLS